MINTSDGDTWRTIPDSARWFGVTERTIRRWIAKGGLTVIRGHVSHLQLAAIEKQSSDNMEKHHYRPVP